MFNRTRPPKKSCSFCFKSEEEVAKLIGSPNHSFICDECVRVCIDLLSDGEEVEEPITDPSGKMLMTPMQIKDKLDEYVVGQDLAKKVLSVAVYNHYKKIFNNTKTSFNEVELGKSNVLLIGPSGVGKTYLAQTLARVLNVPFTIADATTLTEAGYVGEDVETIISKLFSAAEGDIDKTQRGIIYVDEIDKISRKSDSPSVTRDVSGEGVQQALLKLVEGTVAGVSPVGGRKHPNEKLVEIDTTNILFICGGAFKGLEKIVSKRAGKNTIGFIGTVKTDKNISAKVEPDDLLKFGIIPELLGRLPVVVELDDLTDDQLLQIIKEPKNSLLKQYETLFSMDGIRLNFDDKALRAIVKKAREKKLGARSLRAVMEEVMLEVMYDTPSADPKPEELIVTEQAVLGTGKALLVFGKNKKKHT